MTIEGVKNLIARLISDDVFQEKFFKDPIAIIRNSGYSIDAKEADALAKLKPDVIEVMFKEVNERALLMQESGYTYNRKS